MKKILFLLLIGGALFTASCTKRYEVVQPNVTVTAPIASSDWGTANGGLTDTVFITTNQISSYLRDNGLVAVALTFDQGNSYEPIPFVYNNVNFSYIYGKGGIILYAQSADGTQVIPVPAASVAKITLIPAN